MRQESTRQSIISVNAFRCRMWQLHDRVEEHINEDSCRDVIASVSRHGQLVPVMGRTLRNDPHHEIELVFGARRLFAARHLNVPLRVELRDLADREAIVAMDIENRHRQDISPYERGLSYARWLREGHFSCQDDIASALKISASQVSRLLKVARLPPVVLRAFESPADICEGWGLKLAMALDDPLRRAQVIKVARAIAGSPSRPAASDVYRQLLASAVKGRKPVHKRHDEVVLGGDGAPLFRICHKRTSIAVLLPVTRVSARSMQRIQEAVSSILSDETPQVLALPAPPTCMLKAGK